MLFKTQANAIWDNDCPLFFAIKFKSLIIFVLLFVIKVLSNELFSLTRVPFGMPDKYLFDKNPCAKGEKAIHPTPLFISVFVKFFNLAIWDHIFS